MHRAEMYYDYAFWAINSAAAYPRAALTFLARFGVVISIEGPRSSRCFGTWVQILPGAPFEALRNRRAFSFLARS